MNHAVAIEFANRTGRSRPLRERHTGDVGAHSVPLGDTSSPFTTLVGLIQPEKSEREGGFALAVCGIPTQIDRFRPRSATKDSTRKGSTA